VPPSLSTEQQRVRAWVWSTFVVFTLLGAGFGAWLSRLPAIRDYLDATPSQIAVLGLCLATGSITGLILSGRTVTLVGPRRMLRICLIVQSVAMPLAGWLLFERQLAAVVAALFVFGFAFATSDVAANVIGADAERAVGRARLPMLHAGYSLGGVTMMGIGAFAEAQNVPVPLHLSLTFLVIGMGGVLALLWVPAYQRDAPAETPPAVGAALATSPPVARHRSPWRDPRVLAIGGMALAFSLAEGTASDWLPMALVDGYGITNDNGALVLGVLFVSMMVARFAGGPVLSRFSRVGVLRVSAALTLIGLLLVVFSPVFAGAVAGSVLWGFGVAYGFPVGISAAADNRATAPRDVAAVAAISYGAYLLGPLLLGFLGDYFGLLNAFLPLILALALAAFLASWAREPKLESLTVSP
jgi:fucose permease